jgi:hypothetical protein
VILPRDRCAFQFGWHLPSAEPIFAGEAHRPANGNTLINSGTEPVVREVMRDGVVVWEIQWGVPRFIGRAVLLEDLYAFAPE